MPRKKVVGASGGFLVGSQLGDLIIFAIEGLAKTNLPNNVETAIISLVGTAVGALVGYYLRESA